MNRDLVRQIVNVVTVLVTIIVNGLANALPINGITTAEISNSFPVLFVPAGYVFAIWGLIYLGMTGFAIYQALPSQRENPRLRRVGYWFALGNIANIIWIFLWHYQLFLLTLVAMLVLLLSLIVTYQRLEIGQRVVQGAQRWLVNVPMSIYLGWITVATIANTTIVLYDLNWNGFGMSAAIWAVLLLVVATLITGLMIFRRGVWDLPKGKREDPETFKRCAVREVEEETGAPSPVIQQHLIDTYHEYLRNNQIMGKTTRWYAMSTPDSEFATTPQFEEDIEQVKWFPLSEAKDNAGFDNLVDVLEEFEKKVADRKKA